MTNDTPFDLQRHVAILLDAYHARISNGEYDLVSFEHGEITDNSNILDSYAETYFRKGKKDEQDEKNQAERKVLLREHFYRALKIDKFLHSYRDWLVRRVWKGEFPSEDDIAGLARDEGYQELVAECLAAVRSEDELMASLIRKACAGDIRSRDELITATFVWQRMRMHDAIRKKPKYRQALNSEHTEKLVNAWAERVSNVLQKFTPDTYSRATLVGGFLSFLESRGAHVRIEEFTSKVSPRRPVVAIDDAGEPQSLENNPEEDIVEDDWLMRRREWLREAVSKEKKFNKRDKEVFWLRFRDRHSLADIAKTLNVTYDTVKGIMRKIRKAFGLSSEDDLE